MGGPGPRQFVAPAALPGAALQPAPFSIEDLEEHQGGTIVFKMNYKGAYRPADPGDFAPAPGHEDLARSNDRDLRSGRKGATVGVLQPELQSPARRHLEGEGRREENPRAWRHGGVEHELARGALGVDSRRNDAHRHNSPPPAAAASVSLDAFFSRALDSSVQGHRKPRRRPLVPGPRRLLPSTLISAAED